MRQGQRLKNIVGKTKRICLSLGRNFRHNHLSAPREAQALRTSVVGARLPAYDSHTSLAEYEVVSFFFGVTD